MADISVTAGNVRPLNGAILRRGTAGGSGSCGDAVYLDGANGWKQADADALASAQARAIVVAVNGQPGATTFASGDRLDLVVYGPVAYGSGMTPGARVYVSTTAGALDQTAPAGAGDYPFAIGWAEAADILFVQPQDAIPTVNS